MVFFFNFERIKFLKGKKIQGIKNVKANSKTGKVLNLSTIYKNFSFCNKRIRALTIQTLCIPAISKCGIQTSSTSSTWELVRNAHSWAPPRPTELVTGDGYNHLCFNKTYRWYDWATHSNTITSQVIMTQGETWESLTYSKNTYWVSTVCQALRKALGTPK